MSLRTIALAIDNKQGTPVLVDSFSDEKEIMILEESLQQNEVPPLELVYLYRESQCKADEDFADYLEELLVQPHLETEVRERGIEWFHSRIRIEKFQSHEKEARDVIANYAYQLYQEDGNKVDFVLCGPSAKVRIKVFHVQCIQAEQRKGA